MAIKGSRNTLLLILLILTGIVLGGLLGELAANVPVLAFLNYGKTFGFGAGSPLVIDLAVVQITFGLQFHLTVSIIIGIILSILIYKKLL